MKENDPRSPIADFDLLDKKQWHSLVEVEVAAAIEQQAELTVVFVDVDGFKDINDEFGHAEGDEVISDLQELFAEVASSLRASRRSDDGEPRDIVSFGSAPADEEDKQLPIDAVPGRIGGDELAILAKTGDEGAKKIVERIRNRFEKFINEPENEHLKALNIGLSIGAATLKPGMTASDLLKAADEEMYRNKLDNLPDLSEKQIRTIEFARFVLESAGIRVREFSKYVRRQDLLDQS